jgi:pilus assembly protein Flp/PilA
MNIKQIFTALVSDESGQDLVEYALVVALIALGSVATMKILSGTISNLFATVGTSLTTAVA